MPWDTTQSVTASTFQSADGSNYTTTGWDVKFNGGVSTYVGVGTNFDDNVHGVIDLKESNPYAKGSVFSQNLRIRTKYDDEPISTQVRFSPCTVTVPVGQGDTKIYCNPHYSGTYDYQSGKWKNSAGVFFGSSQKINDRITISEEVQRYNLQDLNDNSGKNWSANVIVSVKLP